MSDMSQGPGWWLASDDKWYPPESHPDVVASRATKAESERAETAPVKSAPAEPAPAPVSARPVQSTPTVPPLVFGEGESPKRSKKPWVLGLVVILGLAVAALVVALTSGSDSSFAGGSSGVAFRIMDPGTGHQSFSGTVGAKNITGTVSEDSNLPNPDSGATSAQLPAFTYRGELDTTSYVVHVSLDEQVGQTQLQQDQFAFKVTGTYGSEPVTASATFNLTSLSGSSQSVSFTGHVGSQPIRGMATATMQRSGGVIITGTANAVPTP